MKKVLVSILIIVLFTAITFVFRSQFPSPEKADTISYSSEKISIYKHNADGITIVFFSTLPTIEYRPLGATSVSKTASQQNYSLAFNGSFFDGSYSNAKHAGLLIKQGSKLTDYKNDKQLSGLLILSTQSNTLSIERLLSANSTLKYINNPSYSVIQTGPAILLDGVVNLEDINNSFNGEAAKIRTLVGYTDTRRNFVIVTTKLWTLKGLAERIKSYPEFKSQSLSVINLDGGPSTALYIKNHPEFNVNTNQQLPIIFGVK